MYKNIAIKVHNVSKTFRIPHEKVSSLRGAFVSVFKHSTYEEFKALDDVSFEVKKGEFFGIIGRNGSGKSTLLKILAGIYHPNKGRVHIDGMISPFLELGIGFNPELSGRDNIYLNATVLGMTQKQIDEKFDDIVKFSELEKFIDQKLKNYSSGMQVRLAFSVSIHANRDILLMDEVLAVGDSNFQSKCLTEFVKYKDMGRTVIIVTHDISVIQKYCDKAILLRNGVIMKIGTAEEVSNEYVYENMSDEERRIIDEEKESADQSEKNAKAVENEESEANDANRRVAEISRIEFFDADNNEKNVFESGDDVSVKVHFELFDTSKTVDFGVRIHDENGVYLFGINTFLDKIDTVKYVEDGFFRIDFKHVPLHEGLFHVYANVIGIHPHLAYAYPFAEKMRKFRVISKNKNEGPIVLDYIWEGAGVLK
ncbi:MAG: ABC transporter ATP-binding protein [Candidatus Moranbacteria bacterium]|nr:ABC transporter ATP-binding protein [Candidatus Moranbacteria bacterium]